MPLKSKILVMTFYYIIKKGMSSRMLIKDIFVEYSYVSCSWSNQGEFSAQHITKLFYLIINTTKIFQWFEIILSLRFQRQNHRLKDKITRGRWLRDR